ncbi:MAG: hypothetical protein MJA31_10595 [Clostridia bacterium]|nr:hypothetical protein [Clostridia bacterium]
MKANKKPIFICAVLVVFLILVLAYGCILKYPTYRFLDKEEGSEKVEIDDVIYVSKPDSQWKIMFADKPLGFVENHKMMAFESSIFIIVILYILDIQ